MVVGLELSKIRDQGVPIPSFISQLGPDVVACLGRVDQAEEVDETRAANALASWMSDFSAIKCFLGIASD